MVLKLYNTMTKKKEVFEPVEKGVVKMYNCGLTVYDYAHIGNLLAYTFADIVRRYLEYKGYKVRQVMNFTDVGHMTEDEVITSDAGEDKMEKAAKREKKTVWDIADFYIKAFLEDSRKMNFLEPEVRPRATGHIKEMIKLIQKLIEKGYAYEVNGSVYYDISKFKEYGKLSGNTLEQLKAGAGGRVEENPDKRSQFDFALWINDPDHIMHWESPWSVGYPGWHIECSAMAMKYLGETIDIHTGGVDNIFPHHECEIAQSEAATGKPFSRFWLHTSHLMINGEKMSKSKGNFFTLRDLEKKGYSPKAVRWLLMSANHRTQLNFTEEGLKQAEKTIENVFGFMDRLRGEGDENPDVDALIKKAKTKFEEAMDDDLNTSLAFSAIFDFMREINRLIDEKKFGAKNAEDVRNLMLEFDKVLGLDIGRKEEVPEEIIKMIEKREQLRKERRFEESDRIRSEIEEKGYILEDTPSGVRCRRKI